MKLSIPPMSTMLAVLHGIGGPLAIILGALHVGNLTPSVNNLVLAIGGLLSAITAWHVTSTVTAAPKAKAVAGAGAPPPPP